MAITTVTLSSLSLHSTTTSPPFLPQAHHQTPPLIPICLTQILVSLPPFFSPENQEEVFFDPPTPPEDYIPPPSFDEGPMETEDEIAAAYEELYGPAYSGVSVLGKDVYVMDSKAKKISGWGSRVKKEKIKDGFDERVIQVRRVTKVVKGGKQLHFRAIVVVGDKQGRVGVGVGKAKEVIVAVQKSALNARRNIITVPMTKYLTFPHRYFSFLVTFNFVFFFTKLVFLCGYIDSVNVDFVIGG
ncbi:hypothetical protein OIU78_000333 [Salix suchowensis]|nr:hypothetical protein OIU78_000333 [Salix suchowensis]